MKEEKLEETQQQERLAMIIDISLSNTRPDPDTNKKRSK
jgi:hypothetical protein